MSEKITAYLAKPDHCPHCGAGDIRETDKATADAPTQWRELQCWTCEEMWHEIREDGKLVRIEEAADGRPLDFASWPQWKKEFGPDYDVPDEIAKAADVIDKSWGQDGSPSFWVGSLGVAPLWGKYRVEVWVQHPDKNERETIDNEGRFILCVAEVDAMDSYTGISVTLGDSDDAAEIMTRARNLFLIPDEANAGDLLAEVAIKSDEAKNAPDFACGYADREEFLKYWFAVQVALTGLHPDAGDWWKDGDEAFEIRPNRPEFLQETHKATAWPRSLAALYVSAWNYADVPGNAPDLIKLADYELYALDAMNLPIKSEEADEHAAKMATPAAPEPKPFVMRLTDAELEYLREAIGCFRDYAEANGYADRLAAVPALLAQLPAKGVQS